MNERRKRPVLRLSVFPQVEMAMDPLFASAPPGSGKTAATIACQEGTRPHRRDPEKASAPPRCLSRNPSGSRSRIL